MRTIAVRDQRRGNSGPSEKNPPNPSSFYAQISQTSQTRGRDTDHCQGLGNADVWVCVEATVPPRVPVGPGTSTPKTLTGGDLFEDLVISVLGPQRTMVLGEQFGLRVYM